MPESAFVSNLESCIFDIDCSCITDIFEILGVSSRYGDVSSERKDDSWIFAFEVSL